MAKDDYRNRESRKLFGRLLPKWVKESPEQTSGELWVRALKEGHPLPTRSTWDRWVAKARKKAGVGRPKRRQRSRASTVPVNINSKLVTESDVWNYMADQVPIVHVVVLARRIRDQNVHFVRRRAKLETAADAPPTPSDYVDNLTHLSELARLRITEAAMHLVRVRGWSPDNLTDEVLG